MFRARFELAVFRVLGGRDNHYTTETTVIIKGSVRGRSVSYWKCKVNKNRIVFNAI